MPSLEAIETGVIRTTAELDEGAIEQVVKAYFNLPATTQFEWDRGSCRVSLTVFTEQVTIPQRVRLGAEES